MWKIDLGLRLAIVSVLQHVADDADDLGLELIVLAQEAANPGAGHVLRGHMTTNELVVDEYQPPAITSIGVIEEPAFAQPNTQCLHIAGRHDVDERASARRLVPCDLRRQAERADSRSAHQRNHVAAAGARDVRPRAHAGEKRIHELPGSLRARAGGQLD